MATPEIIGSNRSTYTRVACMVCEEKGIEYVLTETALHAAEIRAIHPFGKMPVLRHGDVELFESKAIATWLDRRYPAPFVFPRSRGSRAHRAMGVAGQHGDRPHPDPDLPLRLHRAGHADGKPNRPAIDAVMPAVREQVAVLDKAVAESGHLVGDQFTFADINLMPILHRLQQAPEGAATLADARHLAAYYARHSARPSFQRTDPPAGPPRRAKAG